VKVNQLRGPIVELLSSQNSESEGLKRCSEGDCFNKFFFHHKTRTILRILPMISIVREGDSRSDFTADTRKDDLFKEAVKRQENQQRNCQREREKDFE
jgi:hypothetical protein